MIVTILLSVLGLASLMALGMLALRKLPQVQVVDPSSSREAKAKERKRAILEYRLSRQTSERVATVKKATTPFVMALRNAFRRIAGKLTAIERRYEERQKKGAPRSVGEAELRRMVDDGIRLFDDGKYDAAEKLFIEVLSIDPKHVLAYERIARLYLVTKQFDNARETLQFLVKLSPKDASVQAALGELADLEGKPDEAYAFYGKAKALSPNNPKYLDFFIEAATEVGDVLEATRSLDHLREVNPDNQKIPELERMINEARQRNKETK